ncbi:MAG: hypothetical protein IPH32_13095 [Bacteroidetes bacterium]|nr:hypothetical protein [Bacteroidota bacterium]
MNRIKCSIILIIGFYSTMFSQLQLEKHYGFNVGFVSALGTHFQRFGIGFQGYGVYDFAQINASFRVYDNFKNLGPEGEHTEFNAALGFCIGYGTKTTEKNLFMSSISNQTGYKNSVAYSYNIWRNRVKTSQVTGIIAFQFNHFSIISENDILAKPILDRFRTGAMLLQYQTKEFQYAINATMWTGQLGNIVKNDSLFPGHGYINTEGGLYQNLSHGLLSAQVKWANEYGQYLQANAGMDSEKIRNALQNKALHDVLPKNYHMPMIDTAGNQYLYRPEQKIKKAKLYLNGYTSPNIFY